MTREEASFYLANMDRKYMEEGMLEALDMSIEALEQKDWRFYFDHGYAHAKRELEKEACDDCISRQAAIDVVRKWFDKIQLNGDICCDGIISLPSVTSQPKTGKWITNGNGDGFKKWHCSICNSLVRNSQKPWYKYCPNCGAKMEKEGDKH